MAENNKLTQAQSFKVMQWISCHKEWVLSNLPPYQEAAERASKELGFSITKHNMESVAKDSDQSWTPKHIRKNGTSVVANLANKLAEVHGRLDECCKLVEQLLTDNQNLHSQVAVLRGSVVTLAKEAKCSPPSFAAKNDAPKLNVVHK